MDAPILAQVESLKMSVRRHYKIGVINLSLILQRKSTIKDGKLTYGKGTPE